MFWAGDDRLLHVSVLDGDNPSDALSLLDESCTAVESAVRHAHLLATVQDDCNAVTLFVVVHNAVDVRPRTVFSSSTKDASCPYSLSLGSLHFSDLHGSKLALR